MSRIKTVGHKGDITALRDVEKRIEDELMRLEKMVKHSENIRKNVDGISDEIQKAQNRSWLRELARATSPAKGSTPPSLFSTRSTSAEGLVGEPRRKRPWFSGDMFTQTFGELKGERARGKTARVRVSAGGAVSSLV